jgi:hypothetical protein
MRRIVVASRAKEQKKCVAPYFAKKVINVGAQKTTKKKNNEYEKDEMKRSLRSSIS